MSDSNSYELARLLSEPSTYSGRTAATLLIVMDSQSRFNCDQLESIFGNAPTRIRIETAQRGAIRALEQTIAASLERHAPVMIELGDDAHPAFYRLLERASKDGVYALPAQSGASGELRMMPDFCPIVVLVDQETIDQRISHPHFTSLFEIVERV